MSKRRSYRLLCPIARALDRVGDRWTLLILRDLHAGPARYKDLQEGLPGLASNLLASRLRQLLEDDLVRQRAGAHGARLYELTADGEATAPLLFALGNYGSRFPPAGDVRRPGNLRLVVVNLRESLRRVAEPDSETRAELVIDGEPFAVRVDAGDVSVRYEADAAAPVSLSVEYEAIIDVVDGRLSPGEFVSSHVQVTRGAPDQVENFLGFLGRGFGAIG